MNRFLTAPLVATLFVFVAVLCSQQSTGEPPQTLTTATSSYDYHDIKVDLLTAKQAETLVLDQWPTSEPLILSRVMPRTKLMAELRIAEHTSNDHSLLGTLFVNATPKIQKLNPQELQAEMMSGGMTVNRPNNVFPIHIDRYARNIKIFAENQWQPYPQWRDVNVPIYKELTGWGK